MSNSKTSSVTAGSGPIVAVNDYDGSVIFQGESAGYRNALGMYTIADDGSISDVRIVFANASLKDSGGDLLAGKSSANVALESGDRVGFFIVPDGFSQSGMSKLLSDQSAGFKLVDANGKPGNVNGGSELKLVHVAQNGAETVVKSAYGTSLFHSVDDGSKGLNGDNLNHVKTSVDAATGSIKIGFEDLKGGGDKDYDDTVFTVNVGKDNAAAIAAGTAEKQVAELKTKAEAEAKAKAEAEAKEKAEHDAKEKAEAEAKSKAEADAKEKAERDAKEKAEHDAKEKAEHDAKEKAEHDAKEKADADAKEKAEHDAKEKADAEAKAQAEHDDKSQGHEANNDDDKHDGRDHGDGDHNDDGHTDNGQGGQHGGHGDQAGDDDHAGGGNGGGGTLDPVDPDALVLATQDMLDFVTGDAFTGNRDGNDIVGGVGNDDIAGKGGDDVLVGDSDASVTVPLDIKVGLTDLDGSERLSIVVGNMPAGALLSAGHDNGDGTWTLGADDLAGLKITAPDASGFTLTVTASTSGVSNLTATSEIHVTLLDGQNDVMQGNGGSDMMFGGAGDDVMYGGSRPTGNTLPHVSTEADNDVLHGGDGNDQMWGNAGDDQLFGEAGNDVISGGKGNDLVDGGDGNDQLSGNTGDDVLLGGAGDDVLKGNSDNDTLSDGDGNDLVEGNSGNDLVLAGEGDDSYNGGSGYDTIDFSGATGGMTIDLSKKTADGMGHDTLWNFEQVIGSSFDDVMKGSKAAETLVGGAGNDTLRGLGGADVLTGGDGSDTFQWLAKDVVDANGKHLGVDTVTDFGLDDVLDLSKMFSGQKWDSVDDVVRVKDDGQSSHVYAHLGASWVEVVALEGVTGLSASDMMKEGMLLV